MKKRNKITIGTRGSILALAQTELVKQQLLDKYENLEIKTHIIKTTGDKIQDKNLYDIGGKALFTKEIEEHLIDERIDIAVHSLKDIPGFFHPDLEIPCVLERKYPFDAIVSNKYTSIADLPKNAVIGTSSPRRMVQALAIRPDLNIVQFRGNIQTRLNKLERGEVDATFLAMAGLKRLSIDLDNVYQIEKNIMTPAVAQGTIGVQVRRSDDYLKEILKPVNHVKTFQCVKAERMFLKEMNGSCRTPIGAYAYIDGENMIAEYMYADENNNDKLYKTTRFTSIDESWNEAVKAAKQLKVEAQNGK